MLIHFSSGVIERGLAIERMAQISMDGPNVNWKFQWWKRSCLMSLIKDSLILDLVVYVSFTTVLKLELLPLDGMYLACCEVSIGSSRTLVLREDFVNVSSSGSSSTIFGWKMCLFVRELSKYGTGLKLWKKSLYCQKSSKQILCHSERSNRRQVN